MLEEMKPDMIRILGLLSRRPTSVKTLTSSQRLPLEAPVVFLQLRSRK